MEEKVYKTLSDVVVRLSGIDKPLVGSDILAHTYDLDFSGMCDLAEEAGYLLYKDLSGLEELEDQTVQEIIKFCVLCPKKMC